MYICMRVHIFNSAGLDPARRLHVLAKAHLEFVRIARRPGEVLLGKPVASTCGLWQRSGDQGTTVDDRNPALLQRPKLEELC